jgi:DNA-binding transcriptional MerR regulator
MSIKIDIPDKIAYKRSEVVKYTKLDGKVLDYWQKEFGGLNPTVNRVGEMFYSRKDVDFIFQLKQWMVVEKIGKTKVKERLNKETAVNVEPKKVSTKKIKSIQSDKLKIIRQNLQEILTLLDKNDI